MAKLGRTLAPLLGLQMSERTRCSEAQEPISIRRNRRFGSEELTLTKKTQAPPKTLATADERC